MWWGFRGGNGFRAIWLDLVHESLNNRGAQHRWPSQSTSLSSKTPTDIDILLPGLCDNGFLHEGTYNNRTVTPWKKPILLLYYVHYYTISPEPTSGSNCTVHILYRQTSRTNLQSHHGLRWGVIVIEVGGGGYLLTQNSVATACTAAAHYSNWWCIKLLLCWYSLSL